MSELKPCPFCEAGLFSGTNVRKKSVVRHPHNPKCPLSEANFLDTPGFRESWNRRPEPAREPVDYESQGRFEFICAHYGIGQSDRYFLQSAIYALDAQPASPANVPLTLDDLLTCAGCENFEKYENEVEYGYPSPCTHCKRRVSDNYRRKPEGGKL